MIALDALSAAIWQRATADADGTALRAALGAGAASILMAEDLRVEGLTIATLPARPFIALRRGPAPNAARVTVRPLYTWYCYDDPAIGYGRLEALPALVGAAYESPLLVPSVGVGDLEVSAGAQTRDATLGMLLVPVTLAIGAI